MDSSPSNCFDIFEYFRKYCDIVLRLGDNAKETLSLLLKSLDERRKSRDTILGDIIKLMPCINMSEDSQQFNFFYDFVFFICRENGQKNISVQRAIYAWRIILHGKFRLLDQWCNFVQNHQKHNISEDTWQQLLAFSKCINEDLDGYDPKGAWPVLIDEFVEHMYRIRQMSEFCVDDSFHQCSISSTFSGLNLLPGSKRRTPPEEMEISEHNSEFQIKRQKHNNFYENYDLNKHNLRGVQTSFCAVEDSLSKGFEGYLSIGSSFQFNQKYI